MSRSKRKNTKRKIYNIKVQKDLLQLKGSYFKSNFSSLSSEDEECTRRIRLIQRDNNECKKSIKNRLGQEYAEDIRQSLENIDKSIGEVVNKIKISGSEKKNQRTNVFSHEKVAPEKMGTAEGYHTEDYHKKYKKLVDKYDSKKVTQRANKSRKGTRKKKDLEAAGKKPLDFDHSTNENSFGLRNFSEVHESFDFAKRASFFSSSLQNSGINFNSHDKRNELASLRGSNLFKKERSVKKSMKNCCSPKRKKLDGGKRKRTCSINKTGKKSRAGSTRYHSPSLSVRTSHNFEREKSRNKSTSKSVKKTKKKKMISLRQSTKDPFSQSHMSFLSKNASKKISFKRLKTKPARKCKTQVTNILQKTKDNNWMKSPTRKRAPKEKKPKKSTRKKSTNIKNLYLLESPLSKMSTMTTKNTAFVKTQNSTPRHKSPRLSFTKGQSNFIDMTNNDRFKKRKSLLLEPNSSVLRSLPDKQRTNQVKTMSQVDLRKKKKGRKMGTAALKDKAMRKSVKTGTRFRVSKVGKSSTREKSIKKAKLVGKHKKKELEEILSRPITVKTPKNMMSFSVTEFSQNSNKGTKFFTVKQSSKRNTGPKPKAGSQLKGYKNIYKQRKEGQAKLRKSYVKSLINKFNTDTRT